MAKTNITHKYKRTENLSLSLSLSEKVEACFQWKTMMEIKLSLEMELWMGSLQYQLLGLVGNLEGDQSGNLFPTASGGKNLEVSEDTTNKPLPDKQEEPPAEEKMQDSTAAPELSERRKSLFEPLEPINGRRPSAESLLPPPDFDTTEYPKGWLIGKKRKLVNVDVVEKMRRIAVHEMNRKDREIDGLNEQLEEDSRCLEHLQIQLVQERSKRTEVERENAMLQEQVTMLMDMLQENEQMDDEGPNEP